MGSKDISRRDRPANVSASSAAMELVFLFDEVLETL